MFFIERKKNTKEYYSKLYYCCYYYDFYCYHAHRYRAAIPFECSLVDDAAAPLIRDAVKHYLVLYFLQCVRIFFLF